jgi:hypothetical protein
MLDENSAEPLTPDALCANPLGVSDGQPRSESERQVDRFARNGPFVSGSIRRAGTDAIPTSR